MALAGQQAIQYAKNTGNDTFTKIWLPLDTNVIDSAAGQTSAHTWTANNGAATSTAQSKFGGSSFLFTRASNQFLSCNANTDFNIGSGDFTVDCWFRLNTLGVTQAIFGQGTSTNASFSIDTTIGTNNKLTAGIYQGASGIATTGATVLSSGTWYHFAFVRSGGNLYIFLNGVQDATNTVSGAANTSASKFCVGSDGDVPSVPLDGYIDAFRFSVGIARWTSTFTPPGVPYS